MPENCGLHCGFTAHVGMLQSISENSLCVSVNSVSLEKCYAELLFHKCVCKHFLREREVWGGEGAIHRAQYFHTDY